MFCWSLHHRFASDQHEKPFITLHTVHFFPWRREGFLFTPPARNLPTEVCTIPVLARPEFATLKLQSGSSPVVPDDPTRSSAPPLSGCPNVMAHVRFSLMRLSIHQGAARVNLSQAIQDLFNDIRDVAQIIAPIAAIIGFIGLGVMYMG